jgi:hypothetical protein
MAGERGGFVACCEKITRFRCVFAVLQARNRRFRTFDCAKMGGKGGGCPCLLGEHEGAPGGLASNDDAADIPNIGVKKRANPL